MSSKITSLPRKGYPLASEDSTYNRFRNFITPGAVVRYAKNGAFNFNSIAIPTAKINNRYTVDEIREDSLRIVIKDEMGVYKTVCADEIESYEVNKCLICNRTLPKSLFGRRKNKCNDCVNEEYKSSKNKKDSDTEIPAEPEDPVKVIQNAISDIGLTTDNIALQEIIVERCSYSVKKTDYGTINVSIEITPDERRKMVPETLSAELCKRKELENVNYNLKYTDYKESNKQSKQTAAPKPEPEPRIPSKEDVETAWELLPSFLSDRPRFQSFVENNKPEKIEILKNEIIITLRLPDITGIKDFFEKVAIDEIYSVMRSILDFKNIKINYIIEKTKEPEPVKAKKPEPAPEPKRKEFPQEQQKQQEEIRIPSVKEVMDAWKKLPEFFSKSPSILYILTRAEPIICSCKEACNKKGSTETDVILIFLGLNAEYHDIIREGLLPSFRAKLISLLKYDHIEFVTAPVAKPKSEEPQPPVETPKPEPAPEPEEVPAEQPAEEPTVDDLLTQLKTLVETLRSRGVKVKIRKIRYSLEQVFTVTKKVKKTLKI